jgi:hypothetical protein
MLLDSRTRVDGFQQASKLATLIVENFELRGDARNQSLRQRGRIRSDRHFATHSRRYCRVDPREFGKCFVKHRSSFRIPFAFTRADGLCKTRGGSLSPGRGHCSKLNRFAVHESVSYRVGIDQRAAIFAISAGVGNLPSSSRAIKYDFKLPSRRRARSIVASRRRSRSRRGRIVTSMRVST